MAGNALGAVPATASLQPSGSILDELAPPTLRPVEAPAEESQLYVSTAGPPTVVESTLRGALVA
jgi:hypothetical protein